MVIDIHAHIWGNRVAESKSQLLKAIDVHNIDKVYISALQSLFPDKEEIAYLNAETYKFMQEQPGRIGGAVYLNPTHDNTMDVLQRACEEQGFEMIKLWASTLADDPSVDPIMDYAEKIGVPVMMHALTDSVKQHPTCSTGVHVANIARRHPKTKMLMAHLGSACCHGIPAIAQLPNVWCDFSGPSFHGEDINYTVEKIGAERLLFGTDMPGPYLTNYGQVMGADLTDEQRELIFYKNAQKLLDRSFRL